LVIVLSVLRLTASDYLLGIFWSLYCLFFDWRLLITSYVSFGHCIVCTSIDGRQYNDQKIPKRESEAVNRRTDNTMTKRYQRGNQKPSIEGQTIQWPKDTYEVIRSRQSYCLFFDWWLLITSYLSFGHCIVCSSIDGFWLPLWYLLVIVLSVLRLTASDYLIGIFWPLYCLSFDWRLLNTSLVSFGHCRGNQKPSIEGQTIQWPKDT
jgi:hypothetical protein